MAGRKMMAGIGLGLTLACFGCTGRDDTVDANPAIAEPSANARAVAAGQDDFAWALYGRLRATSGNLVFSPFCIGTTLDMASAGAGGKTASEFSRALHALPDEGAQHAGMAELAHRYDGVQHGGITIAERLFGAQDHQFKSTFLALCQDVYRAPLGLTTFPDPGRDVINGWVANTTGQHITNLIPAGGVTAITKLVLVDAITFQGTWLVQFDRAHTADGAFTRNDSTTVTVPFMNRNGKMLVGTIGGSTGGMASLVELPYVGNGLVMDLIIPGYQSRLATIEPTLDGTSLRTALGAMVPVEAELSIPSFSLGWSSSLNDALTALGLSSAFSAADADFSRMSDVPLFITDVVHKATITVDEQGTVAAAAASVAFGVRSAHRSILANQPFLVFIRDVKTDAILFIARVADPSAVGSAGSR